MYGGSCGGKAKRPSAPVLTTRLPSRSGGRPFVMKAGCDGVTSTTSAPARGDPSGRWTTPETPDPLCKTKLTTGSSSSSRIDARDRRHVAVGLDAEAVTFPRRLVERDLVAARAQRPGPVAFPVGRPVPAALGARHERERRDGVAGLGVDDRPAHLQLLDQRDRELVGGRRQLAPVDSEIARRACTSIHTASGGASVQSKSALVIGRRAPVERAITCASRRPRIVVAGQRIAFARRRPGRGLFGPARGGTRPARRPASTTIFLKSGACPVRLNRQDRLAGRDVGEAKPTVRVGVGLWLARCQTDLLRDRRGRRESACPHGRRPGRQSPARAARRWPRLARMSSSAVPLGKSTGW